LNSQIISNETKIKLLLQLHISNDLTFEEKETQTSKTTTKEIKTIIPQIWKADTMDIEIGNTYCNKFRESIPED